MNHDPLEHATVRVLFVDDEEPLLRAFLRALRSAPYEVASATCADDALLLLQEQQFDIIVSDYRMPGVDGVEFLTWVQDIQPNARRVLMTAYADLEATRRAINEAHISQLLYKPVSIDQVLSVLRDIAHQIALQRDNEALERQVRAQNEELRSLNRHLDAQVRRRTQALLHGMIAALEYRDSETQWHSRRVALYCHTLAKELGLDEQELTAIKRGALLHDIGKIGIPDAIVLKPGKLDEDEWKIMRTHTEKGFHLLGSIDFLGNARRIVREHHEHFAGGGYPRGLTGADIYVGARIFAVADCVDAMTSNRPYRKAMPFETARAEVRKYSGTQFDQQVVEAFERISDASWKSAVRVGVALEAGEPIPDEVRHDWQQSPFAAVVGDAEDADVWFDYLFN